MRSRVPLTSGAVLSLTLLAAGCATKSDVRDVQEEVARLAARQDSLLSETRRQTQVLLDTLESGFNVQRDLRGETSHRFEQLEQNLSRLEEMINQTQLVVSQLLERLDRTSMSGPAGGGGQTPAMPGAAEEIYQQGQTFLQQESYATARMAFEQILQNFTSDPRVPDAQYGLAETFAGEGELDRAIEEFEKVERQWPRHERAPQALLRAGVVALQANERDRARDFFQQVRQRYPSSPEAEEAERQLRSIR
jgi:tol-pal system protein YbgF